MPLFISAGFVLCHVFSVYLPTVEINVEVIEENRGAEGTSDHEEVIIYIGKMILKENMYVIFCYITSVAFVYDKNFLCCRMRMMMNTV